MQLSRKFNHLVIGLSTLSQVACGTILYPERAGQAQRGLIDTSVVLLDGLGLFFFIVPGVIAFAVDFSNNTIYLPAGKQQEFTFSDSRPVRFNSRINNGTIDRVIEHEVAVAHVTGHSQLQVSKAEFNR